jgi:cytidylate kinase
MYRAITLRVLEEKIPLADGARIAKLAQKTRVHLERSGGTNTVFVDARDVTKEIRSIAVTRSVSVVSSYQAVRDVLVREQRRMAKLGGAVLEGRDIGTVVLPSADLKIYMVARVAERVKRRKIEIESDGSQVEPENLEHEILERDRLDSSRKASPLSKAPDAIELDTSDLTIEEQVQFVIDEARKVAEKKGR